MFTLVLGSWVVWWVKLSIGILSVIDIVLLVVSPAQTKSFTFWCWPWCFINYFHIISIWSRLLIGITQNHGRDRFSISFAKSTTFWIQRRRNLGLQYITIVRTVIFETTIFWKTIFLRTMTPSSSRLVPPRTLLWQRYMCIAEQHRTIGTVIIVEVGSVWLIATHMMSLNHTLILSNPLLTCHRNKFMYVL